MMEEKKPVRSWSGLSVPKQMNELRHKTASHQTNGRKNKRLVNVNCAASPDSLIEIAVFGYEKGVFTGAGTEDSKGYRDQAHERRILLDEIGDSYLSVQSNF